ncbi:LacI family DNA-binding transcriptional regulator [Gracilibacillus oryzae]|uniref:LacI family DNA-binding transcriptional regulator n=1 Tax=Gracilibacillus oryzae TaxID=1672701 RepID=A0A7C8KX93_9BACI|nr:LacI family DNA-binding transcriptional regulator [Gracilibacillus oryzae]KAB8129900.1 LacI family DNA-binding transcriptional regulator [Gracilibacillus oryzae]
MTNIRDIAKMAGVSVTTVSRVINNHPYVSEEKRNHVLEVMKKTNYQINMKAVQLSKGKSQMIGVVVPFATNPFFGLLIEGIANQAVKHHFHFVLIQTNYEKEREQEALNMLKHKQIDGLIITSRIAEMQEVEAYVPYGEIVVCENATNNQLISSVYLDHYQVIFRALQYLYNHGHRKIGYCTGRESGANSYYRKKAYKEFLEEKELSYDSSYVFTDNFFFEDGHEIVSKIVSMKNPPTALLVTSDGVAAGILTAGEKVGINVPDELAIIAFDNQPSAKMLDITTFEVPLVQMGEKLFLQAIGKYPIRHEELEVTLIERKTV